MLLDSHVLSENFQPSCILLHKALIVRQSVCFQEASNCFFHDWTASIENLCIIHFSRIISKISSLDICLVQQTFFYQNIKIDKVGIPRKSRERLIWRITITGRSQWQNLPIALLGANQEVYKIISTLAKRSDTVLARKG